MRHPSGFVPSPLDTLDDLYCQDKHHSYALADLLRDIPAMLEYFGEKRRYIQRLMKILHMYWNQPLCPTLRRNLAYIMAILYQEMGDLPCASQYVELALEGGRSLIDDPTNASLYYLNGEIERGRISYQKAFDCYQQAYVVITRMQSQGIAVNREAKFMLNMRLAGQALDLNKIKQCSGYLANAEVFQRQGDGAVIDQFLLDWHHVQVLRMENQPTAAYKMAKQTIDSLNVELYKQQPGNVGRFYTMSAECALDIAAIHCALLSDRRAFSPLLKQSYASLAMARQYDPNDCLAFAHKSLEKAEYIANEVGDTTGMQMASLAQRRRIRLGGYIINHQFSGERNVNVAVITIRIAQRLGDIPLEGRARTSLGDELLAQGDRNGAGDQYANAYHLLDASKLHGLKFWPKQKLIMLSAQ